MLNYQLVIVLSLAVILFFTIMVLSSMAATDAGKMKVNDAKKNSARSAIIAAASSLAAAAVLGYYVYYNRGQFQSAGVRNEY